MPFVVWVQGRSWRALHTKSQVSRLLMSRNKWLQQMREVQRNSKTGYLAVHQLLSHCQAFSQLYKEKKKKLKGILKRENPIQGWIPPAAQGCSSQRYLPLSPYLRGSMYCLQFCVCEMWWYGGILKTKGRIFSLKGNKNVLSQNTKSFPRLSPLQTMHS